MLTSISATLFSWHSSNNVNTSLTKQNNKTINQSKIENSIIMQLVGMIFPNTLSSY